MYDMINIFEVFLPQLLRYPNPSDPLNGEAAAMLMREPKSYEAKVKGTWLLQHYWEQGWMRNWSLLEYVAKYASREAVDEAGEDTESEGELSSAGSYESDEEEPAGTMDDVWLNRSTETILDVELTLYLNTHGQQIYCIYIRTFAFRPSGSG